MILVAALFQCLKLDVIQRRLAAVVSNEIKAAYDIPLSIEKIEIHDISGITLKNVCLLGLDGDTILDAEEAIAHISPLKLLDNELCINTLILAAPDIAINRASKDAPLNIQFIIDNILEKQKKKSESHLTVSINQCIVYDGKTSFDIKDKIERQTFDPYHIYISDLCCNISLKQFTKENFKLNIRSVRGKEKSGLAIKELRARVETKDGYLYLKDLETILPGSAFQSDSIKIGYNNSNPSSLTLQGVLRSPLFSAATLSPIIPGIEDKIPDMAIEVIGSIDSISATGTIALRSFFDNSFALNGECQMSTPYENRRSSDITIHSLTISEHHIDQLLSYVRDDHSRISSMLGDISFKGDTRISQAGISGKGHLTSSSGNIDATLELDSNGKYTASLNGQNIKLAAISRIDMLQSCDIEANASGSLKKKNGETLIDASIRNLVLNGYKYASVNLAGTLANNRINAEINADDPNLKADIDLEYDTRPGTKSTLSLILDNINLHNLNLTEGREGESFSMQLTGEHHRFEDGKRATNIKIDNLVHRNEDKENVLQNLYITDSDAGGHRTLVLHSDFMEGSIAGDFDLKGIKRSIYNVFETHLPSLGIKSNKEARGGKNRFYYKLDVKNTEFLSNIINLPLNVHEKLFIEGHCDDSIDYLTMNADLRKIYIGESLFRSIDIDSRSDADNFFFSATIHKPIIRNKKTFDYSNRDNDITILLNSDIDNDTIRNVMKWRNAGGDNNMLGTVRVDASVSADNNGTPLIAAKIHKDSIRHYGNVWYTSEGSITGNHEALELKDISLYNRTQSLSLKGVVGTTEKDTLSIHADNFEISTIMDLINFKWLKIQGKVTGDGYLTSALSAPDVDSNVHTDSLYLDYARVGEAYANIGWSNDRKEIYLNGRVRNDNNDMSYVNGFFSQPRDTVELKIKGTNLNAAFIEEKIKGFLDNIDGVANGEVALRGKWSTVDLYGGLTLNASTRVKATNTRYWFRGDSLKFDKGLITFNKANVYDRNGNHGTLSGVLKHSNFSHWDCELLINADKLLVYDTNDYGSYPFYGNIFATGNAKINAIGNLFSLKANLRTTQGSRLVYNSTEKGGVRDNSFVTFRDSGKERHSYNTQPVVEEEEYKDVSSKINLDFMLDVTDAFGLKVFTNTKTDDYIDLYGNGTIQAIYDEKEGFTMNGKLNLERGTYKFTIQDIFPKEFSIIKGSSIHFQGDPFNAHLDLKTKHLIPSASLGDLTTETSQRNTVKVNCLMNITNTLKSPALNFDLELPEGSEEERELLASVASTQEQKNMQFLYLLGIGKFYTFDNMAGSGYMESSTAVESLISNTLSGQLNNMLGHIIDNRNWDFSGNFSTSERGWSRMEVEGMLKGRLLDNRLLINGNFGYRDNPIANRNFIGDFEVQWLLTPEGTISLKAYSKTNDRYFSKTNLTTQGGGIMFRFDFDKFIQRKKKKDAEENEEEKEKATKKEEKE